jgi:hypothetical protein
MASSSAGNSGNIVRLIDSAGVIFSVVCAVHCALTPVLLALIPFSGLDVIDHSMKIAMVALAGVAISWGAVSHRSYRALPPMFVGIALLGTAEYWLTDYHVPISLAGAAALILAHVFNAKACRHHCDCPPAEAIGKLTGPHSH